MAIASKSASPWLQQSQPSKPRWMPPPYQKKACKFLVSRQAAALFLDPGLGKTSITLAAIKTLKNVGVFKGALVVAPLRPVYSVWPNEVAKWLDFEGLSIGILHGKNKDAVLQQKHDIYVINFEGLEWLFGTPDPNFSTMFVEEKNADIRAKKRAIEREAWRKEAAVVRARTKLLLSNADTLVIDELSKMKHVDTGRAKALKPHLAKFVRRWGLTGSPAPNGLMDLFGQCYCLDMGAALGAYVTHFRNQFFYASGFGGYSWTLQPGAAEKIYTAIKPLALRMEAVDFIDMPSIIPVTIYVDLPDKARKMYDAMEDELFAEADGNEFIAVNAASASTKCAQIANGALYNDRVDPLTGLPLVGKREFVEIHQAKLAAMEELIDELQGKPILWAYHFEHDLARIVKKLGKETLHMAVSANVGEVLVRKWNRNEITNLFCHPASVGHGLNMQEGRAHHVAFFNVPWDFELYDQFIRRLCRQGNGAKNVFVYHIVTRGTIDEAKMRALSKKNTSQAALLNALKDYRASRK